MPPTEADFFPGEAPPLVCCISSPLLGGAALTDSGASEAERTYSQCGPMKASGQSQAEKLRRVRHLGKRQDETRPPH